MADIENKKENGYDSSSIIKIEEGESAPSVETSDRGIFDFMGKKEDQKRPYGQEEEANLPTEFDQKVHVSELEKKNQGLLQKFCRSDGSSSSEEEVEVDGQKIKKKKGLKEKIKEKLTGDSKKEDYDTQVPIEKYEPIVHGHVKGYEEPIVHGHVEGEDHENKGFLGKIKEKLPGVAGGEEVHIPPAPVAAETPTLEGEATEKKGFLENINEKLSRDVGGEEFHTLPSSPAPVPAEATTLEGDSTENKGFLEKIKEKVSGGASGQNEEVHTPPPPVAIEATAPKGETTEKKGFFEKMKEKFPGHHSKTEVDNFEPHVPLDHGPTH